MRKIIVVLSLLLIVGCSRKEEKISEDSTNVDIVENTKDQDSTGSNTQTESDKIEFDENDFILSNHSNLTVVNSEMEKTLSLTYVTTDSLDDAKQFFLNLIKSFKLYDITESNSKDNDKTTWSAFGKFGEDKSMHFVIVEEDEQLTILVTIFQ